MGIETSPGKWLEAAKRWFLQLLHVLRIRRRPEPPLRKRVLRR